MLKIEPKNKAAQRELAQTKNKKKAFTEREKRRFAKMFAAMSKDDKEEQAAKTDDKKKEETTTTETSAWVSKHWSLHIALLGHTDCHHGSC